MDGYVHISLSLLPFPRSCLSLHKYLHDLFFLFPLLPLNIFHMSLAASDRCLENARIIQTRTATYAQHHHHPQQQIVYQPNIEG